jgi:hypothetical protein
MTGGHTLSPKNLTPILDPLHSSLRNSKFFPNPSFIFTFKSPHRWWVLLWTTTTNLVDPEFPKRSTHNLVVMALVESETLSPCKTKSRICRHYRTTSTHTHTHTRKRVFLKFSQASFLLVSICLPTNTFSWGCVLPYIY